MQTCHMYKRVLFSMKEGFSVQNRRTSSGVFENLIEYSLNNIKFMLNEFLVCLCGFCSVRHIKCCL